MYGFASGATERTSMRAERSLPSGMRTIAPRVRAEALIWLGASKGGARGGYEFTLAFRIRQTSVALARMRSMKSQPAADRPSSPFASWNRFRSSFAGGGVG